MKIIGKDTEATVFCFLKLFLRGFLPGLWFFYSRSLRERILAVHIAYEVLAERNEEKDFGKYYSVMYTGTNSRSARIKRADIFYKYCLAK